MTSENFWIKKVAILGAGVMGAQIAAHLANAKVPVVLFDLPAKEGDKNSIALKAIANLTKLEPSPFSIKSIATDIVPANYEQHLELLQSCDLIIEAISERMDWKLDLYKKISPYLSSDCIFATNTSGLSIAQLADTVDTTLRSRFCGIHFFNPPRYMNLVELIPQPHTHPQTLNNLETFLVTTLGKGVIRAKDTPSFIANRIGVYSMVTTLHHAQSFGLPPDVVDTLTGPLIGRAKSATYRTADVVGLDTLAHVIQSMATNLPQDPWRSYFKVPSWIENLISKGAIGQKVGIGVYKKSGKNLFVFDPQKEDYRPNQEQVPHDEVLNILKNKNPSEKFAQLRNSTNPQAQFLWSIFRDLFHYCAVTLQDIADNTRDLDLAMRWGYGWSMGPFEIWQSAGWEQILNWINEDIHNGKTLSNVALPQWVSQCTGGVHRAEGSFAPQTLKFQGRSQLPVYARQLFPERVLNEQARYGSTVLETEAVRLWHMDDGIAVLSFKSKMHAVGDDVLDGIIKSVAVAEKSFKGLVLWQTEPPFSAGANLAQVLGAIAAGEFEKIEGTVAKFQQASLALKHSLVPTIAAVNGLALGGGCEFVMHCSRAVVSLETYMGLVEAGVGLLPAGGGCKEFAIRAFREARGGNVMPFIQRYFENMAMAHVSKSGEHAKELCYLKPDDIVLFNQNELLYVAKKQALALAESGYRPPTRTTNIPVAGRGAIATLQSMLVNMREGGFISEHDALVATNIAIVLCGGNLDAGTLVDEEWFLSLERKFFMELIKTKKTQERIDYMLKNGKPLRN